MDDSVTAAWLTKAVVDSAGAARDGRTRALFTKLIEHLHAFVREVELTPQEWMSAIEFLTATGKKCDDFRQEFILLSDTTGISMLVDALASGRASGSTESTVLGPFFTLDAHDVAAGGTIAKEGSGYPLWSRSRAGRLLWRRTWTSETRWAAQSRTRRSTCGKPMERGPTTCSTRIA